MPRNNLQRQGAKMQRRPLFAALPLCGLAFIVFALIAGCVLAQDFPQPPALNPPAPPALKDAELISNAALFFKTAQTTAAAITETVGLVGKGIYFEGVKDGAMGAGLLAAVAYWIVSSRKESPPAKP